MLNVDVGIGQNGFAGPWPSVKCDRFEGRHLLDPRHHSKAAQPRLPPWIKGLSGWQKRIAGTGHESSFCPYGD